MDIFYGFDIVQELPHGSVHCASFLHSSIISLLSEFQSGQAILKWKEEAPSHLEEDKRSLQWLLSPQPCPQTVSTVSAHRAPDWEQAGFPGGQHGNWKLRLAIFSLVKRRPRNTTTHSSDRLAAAALLQDMFIFQRKLTEITDSVWWIKWMWLIFF